MAVKTITIDMEAYDLLAAEKRDSESFSMVIKRRLKPSTTARALLETLPAIVLSEDALDKTDDVIGRREDSLADSPMLRLSE